MYLLIFSRPFWSPLLQTRKPAMTVIIIKTAISVGFDSMVPNTLSAEAESMPPWKVPVTNFTK